MEVKKRIDKTCMIYVTWMNKVFQDLKNDVR